MNFIWLAAGMAVVIIGFLLMTGPSSTPDHFEPDIFSVRRIKVAPLICLAGFVSVLGGGIYFLAGWWKKKGSLVRHE